MADLLDVDQTVIAQTYIDNPFLINGLKFDLRLYVLLYGVNPLRIYLFEEGLARFATTPYCSAKQSDITNMFMHLTNYAINKQSKDYVPNKADNSQDCHKRSLGDIFSVLKKKGHNVSRLKADIRDLVIKTLITGQNYLNHVYRQCQPENLENQQCF